jgi:hypothetical protein
MHPNLRLAHEPIQPSHSGVHPAVPYSLSPAAVEADDFGAVDEPVDDGGGDDGVTEGFESPSARQGG